MQAAAWKGGVKVIKLLLARGARINAQGGQYGNALQAAASQGYIEAVKLLLDQGADVNAQGGQYGNALQAAAVEAPTTAAHLFWVVHKSHGGKLLIA